MRQLKILIVLLVIGLVIWNHIPSTAPAVTVTDSQVQVGADSGDHAVFTASDWSDLRGTSIKYSYDSFGIGGSIFRQLGGRAMISFMGQAAYDRLDADRSRTGQSMADCLSDSDAAGAILHLVLIPRDAEVMSKMRDLNLDGGGHFHMSGNSLIMQSAVLDGGSLHDTPGNIGYFLVDNIERE